ncbi:MAG: BMP family ABC transporter substrate-binding protein [Anaerolineae bacterium]
MRRRLLGLITLLMVLMMVAACTGGATPAPEAAKTEAPPAKTEEAAPAKTEEAKAEPTQAPATEEAKATEAPAATQEAVTSGGKKKYGQVTDTGGVDDKSFNQGAWEGMQKAGKEFGVDVQYLESQQQTDYEKNINEFVNQGYNGIVTVGFLLGDATKVASEKNPDIPFAIVDYPSQTKTDMGLLFAVDQPSFVAGYLAAGMSQTGIVCTFGGIKIPPVVQFMVAFEQGVLHYNKVKGTEVKVLGWKTDAAAEGGGDGVFAGNFESTDDGRRIAENFFDEGCDIIFPVAGPVGIGSAAATADRGFMMIGVDTDWYERLPDSKEIFLTSVLKNINVAVYDAVKAMADGSFKGGTNYLGTFENDGVGIASYHDFDSKVPDELKKEVEQLQADIASGKQSTGWPVGGEAKSAEGEAMAAPAAGELGSAEKPINVLFVPSVDAGVIVSGGDVMAKALNEATGLNFKVDVPTSYAATVEAMCASPEDTIGFIPALGYVLNNKCGVEVGAAAVRRGTKLVCNTILGTA